MSADYEAVHRSDQEHYILLFAKGPVFLPALHTFEHFREHVVDGTGGRRARAGAELLDTREVVVAISEARVRGDDEHRVYSERM